MQSVALFNSSLYRLVGSLFSRRFINLSFDEAAKVASRVVKKTVFFISCFFREKNVFFSFFSVFFLASDFFTFKDLTYNYCKLMMLFKTQTFLFD